MKICPPSKLLRLHKEFKLFSIVEQNSNIGLYTVHSHICDDDHPWKTLRLEPTAHCSAVQPSVCITTAVNYIVLQCSAAQCNALREIASQFSVVQCSEVQIF